MRLHLSVSKSNSVVPFDHVPTLVGTLHKWLGPKNEWHNEVSLYSFSWLKGGNINKQGFSFSDGAEWFISSPDTTLLKRLMEGIQQNPEINYGLVVRSITIQEDPIFGQSNSFMLASPVLIKRKDGEHVRHYLYSDQESDQFLTETLITKLKKAGIPSDGVQVSFDRSYHSPKTKLVNYNGIKNKTSLCPVIISGKPEQIAFAWNVGIGNSTGTGFGALN